MPKLIGILEKINEPMSMIEIKTGNSKRVFFRFIEFGSFFMKIIASPATIKKKIRKIKKLPKLKKRNSENDSLWLKYLIK